MLANIYLSRKFINTNFVTILMPLNRTRHNCDKFLWYKSCVLRINIYIYIYESICIQKKCPLRCQYFTHLAAEVLHTITPTSQLYIYIYIYMCSCQYLYRLCSFSSPPNKSTTQCLRQSPPPPMSLILWCTKGTE